MSLRLAGLTSWRSDWAGLRVVVLGAGVTGFSVADTLAELGCRVRVVAASADKDRAELLSVIGVELVIHPGVPEDLSEFDPEVLIVSPGFRPTHPLLLWARESGVPIWGDIELAWRLRDKVLRPDRTPAEWLLITGTNGKTTATQLTARMLLAEGFRAVPAGNIGVPVLDAIRDPSGFDMLVVEVSSFQAHWLTIEPGPGAVTSLASVCLNLAEDHLDWHGSLTNYRDDKARVYQHTRLACVYNLADVSTRKMVEDAEVVEGCRAIGFGVGIPDVGDLGVVEEILVDRAFPENRETHAQELATLEDLQAVGLASPHGVQNALASAGLALAAGASPASIRAGIRAFRGDEHRSEIVARSRGILWVNDSKATNAHAADASLRAHDGVVWILGGMLKGTNPQAVIRAHAKRLRAVVLIGLEQEALRQAFDRHAPEVPIIEITVQKTSLVMHEAVRAAAVHARSGDVVLLAPLAASMDQFVDYADRGRAFRDAVREYLGGEIK